MGRLEAKLDESNRLAQVQVLQQALLISTVSSLPDILGLEDSYTQTRVRQWTHEVLQAFMKGKGVMIDPAISGMVSEWIHTHTGKMPRVEVDGSGSYTMYRE